MKIALVHDFLNRLGGAERVLKVLSELCPNAPIYTLLYDADKVSNLFPRERIRTSKLSKYPKFIQKRIKYLIPQLPKVIESFDFSGYDLVISSSSAFAHGILTDLNTKHINYSHSPMRSLWDWKEEYLDEQKKGKLTQAAIRYLSNNIRIWDLYASKRPDIYLANSINVQKRIQKYYRREAKLVYPPVDIKRFKVQSIHQNYFLIVSTLTPYKKIDLAIKLFNKIGRKLLIIGDGPQRNYLESIAAPNIEFLGFKPDETVSEYMQNCRALIFPGEEDFGITPVEAMACGKPVLGLGKGGLLETVIPGQTGELFEDNSISSMEDGLSRLLINEADYQAENIRAHAEQFSQERFISEFKEIIKNL